MRGFDTTGSELPLSQYLHLHKYQKTAAQHLLKIIISHEKMLTYCVVIVFYSFLQIGKKKNCLLPMCVSVSVWNLILTRTQDLIHRLHVVTFKLLVYPLHDKKSAENIFFSWRCFLSFRYFQWKANTLKNKAHSVSVIRLEREILMYRMGKMEPTISSWIQLSFTKEKYFHCHILFILCSFLCLSCFFLYIILSKEVELLHEKKFL